MESGQDYCKVGLIIYIYTCVVFLFFLLYVCIFLSVCLLVWLTVRLPFQKERITEEVLELHAFILLVLRMLLPDVVAAVTVAAFFPLFSFSNACRSASYSLKFYCQTLRWIWICMSFWIKRTDLVESARICQCRCMRSVNVCRLIERERESKRERNRVEEQTKE